MKRLGDWFGGMIVAAIFATQLLPVLASIFEDPLANHGAAYIALIGDRPEDVWIVVYDVGRRRSLLEETDDWGYRIGTRSERGTMGGKLMSAPEGRRQAAIHYRIGFDDEVRAFRFAVDIVAGYECRMVVAFEAEGPGASACINPHSTGYAGWPD